jgi:hypothetical protein
MLCHRRRVRVCVRACVCVDFVLFPGFPISLIMEHWIMDKPVELM